MRFLKCEVTNFGSYKHLEIDFSNVGLGLIYGRTGSGKSTIPDMPCWILFGQTAKDGNADEVRSWHASEPTQGTLEVELLDSVLIVTRIRGRPQQNDLYWTEGGETYRGKDMIETQKMLEARLGVSSSLYLSAAYFSEFSPTASFFLAKAKDRRTLFEKIASLALPVKLAEKASEARKGVKKLAEEQWGQLTTVRGNVEQLEQSLGRLQFEESGWERKQEALIASLEIRLANFAEEKTLKIQGLKDKLGAWAADASRREDTLTEQVQALMAQAKDPTIFTDQIKDLEQSILTKSKSVCSACGGPTKNARIEEERRQLDALKAESHANERLRDKLDSAARALETLLQSENPWHPPIKEATAAQNPYEKTLQAERKKTNPYTAQLAETSNILTGKLRQLETLGVKLEASQRRVTGLTQLYDLSFELRGALLKKSVKEIETATNRYLETYFDAEIRVTFSIEDADSLEVEIQKSGNTCVYRQLSKGQRQLLKLCFSVAVMDAAANKAGTHFANLFFDEALDGTDADLKVRAFGLFQELETNHETVLLIDHAPEFQQLFSKRYHVTMDSDVSAIELEDAQ